VYSGGVLLGAFNGSTNGYNFWSDSRISNKMAYSINGLYFKLEEENSKIGLNSLGRDSETTLTVIGSTNVPKSGSSTGFNSAPIYLLARNRPDIASVDLFSTERIGFLAIGADMTAEYSAIETAIQ